MTLTTDTGVDDVWTDEDLSALGIDSTDPDFDNSSLEGTGGGYSQYSIDPTSVGFPVGGFQVDVGVDQDDQWSPSSASSAFDQAAQSHLSHVKKRRGPKTLEKVTVDDFDEGPEQAAFQIIMDYAHKLLSKNTKDKDFKEGLSWFFGDLGANELTFNLCCDVLGARADVIRLRIQYEWFRRGTSFTGPFNFTTVGAPGLMQGEILFHGGKLGFALAREIWVQPGISTKELIFEVGLLQPEASLEQMKSALEALQERHILSLNVGWYFTGRNPMLMNMRSANVFGKETSVGGSVHWARLFAQ